MNKLCSLGSAVRTCVFVLVLLAVGPAMADTRIALIIGVGAYQNAPALANAVADAQSIGDALRRLNFEVTELHDPDYATLTHGLREFGIRAQSADAAVVYYAGHGVQVGGENYLLPTDAKLEREHDLVYETLPLSLVLDEVSQASKVGIVLLDACRNNPFIERLSRSFTTAGRTIATTPGLARVDKVPPNTLVAMSTRADQVADDGSDGHSPFAEALVAHLQIPGLELGLFFRSVRDTVLKATQNRQEPYVFSSLGAEPFYFYPRPPDKPPVIGTIAPLQVLDTAGPTPLGIPRPTHPYGEPLTVRIIGLPRSGEVRIEGKRVTIGEAYAVDRFMTATFKPDGKTLGPVGTLDILVEDGRGGSVIGSLPISVKSRPPVVEPPHTVRAAPTPLGIGPPTDPDGNPVTVTIEALPQGTVLNGTVPVHVGDRLRADEVSALSFVPDPGVAGAAGSLRYLADDGRGGTTEGRVDVVVGNVVAATTAPPVPAAPPPAAPPQHQQLALAAPPPVPAPAHESGADRVVPAVLPRPAPPPSRPLPADAIQDCPDCPVLLRVPAGSFVMGQGAKYPESLPPHRVTVRAFVLSQFPVTVAEFQACVDGGGCASMPPMPEAQPGSPVHNVSWDDAQQYVAWLSHRTGHRYRLPSEAEWEYAARAGTTTHYWWGNEIGVEMANCAACGGHQDEHAPLPVDAFRPNAFGLYDMAGGVAQWVADCWVASYRGAPEDGSARDSKFCLERVLRGGSFRGGPDDIAVTARNYYDSSVRYIANGFRVARDPG